MHKEKEFLLEYYFINELSDNEKYIEIMDSYMLGEIYQRKNVLYKNLNKELIEQKKKLYKK